MHFDIQVSDITIDSNAYLPFGTTLYGEFMDVVGLMKNMMRMKPIWVVWVMILGSLNIVGGVYFFNTLEGKLAIVCMVFGIIVMSFIHGKYGFVRLLGLGHTLWLLLVPWYAMEVLQGKVEGHLALWMWSVVGINSLSLIIDIMDVARYFGGDKEPVV
ncbi:MAG: hypothetical protein KC493_06830 [Bacteriovoracaceae bacterium]|nr:hypothetical protein [Bacteriovoracaceae bacterium]